MNGFKGITVVSITLIFVFVSGIEANAKEKRIQKKDVPAAVISAFEKAYPNAKVKGFSTEAENGKTYFEVESSVEKMGLDVSYLSDGTVVEIEEQVTVESLPDAVKATLKTNFSKARVVKAEKKTVGSTVSYELKVTFGKSKSEVEIDPGGKVLRK